MELAETVFVAESVGAGGPAALLSHGPSRRVFQTMLGVDTLVVNSRRIL